MVTLVRNVVVLLLLMACGGTSNSPTEVANTGTPTCTKQGPELRTWIADVFDASVDVAPPWPTGDAAFDAELEQLRSDARVAAANASEMQTELTDGVSEGPLNRELAQCERTINYLADVTATAPADERVAAYVSLADVIDECDCTISIPRVKALIYLGQRGPD